MYFKKFLISQRCEKGKADPSDPMWLECPLLQKTAESSCDKSNERNPKRAPA